MATSNPTPILPAAPVDYHDMTPQAKWLIFASRALSVLTTITTFITMLAGMLPATFQPYVVLVLGVGIPGIEWGIRKVCDWLDNGLLDNSYTG